MKIINIAFWSVFAVLVAVNAQPAQAEAVVKKVCHEDAKTKKEVCKNVKTHKKVEGTKVPEKSTKK
jgi:uncharacterized protein YcfJ